MFEEKSMAERENQVEVEAEVKHEEAAAGHEEAKAENEGIHSTQTPH
jgi:hypothetical protein